jgi:hypothetical protein
VRVSQAVAASQNCRPILKAIRLASGIALGAHKTIRPADSLQIIAASSLVGEHPLKIQKGRRESYDHPRTLPMVSLGVNRIGMVQTDLPSIPLVELQFFTIHAANLKGAVAGVDQSYGSLKNAWFDKQP